MDHLVNPKERVYFAISLAVSLAIYLALVISVVGVAYLVGAAAVGLVLHGLFIGAVRGNGVRVSPEQFPEVDRLAREIAAQMGIAPVPAVYVLQAGGLLNAFATRFLKRDFIVIYSDVLELAYEKGEAELAFVLAHELAHVKRRHLVWQPLLAPSSLIPFLGSAYSRACEHTCDRFAAYCRPDGAVGGLLILAAGKRLCRQVNATAFREQAATERGFWVWLAEVVSSHPHLSRRLAAVTELVSVAVPGRAAGGVQA